MTNEKEVTRVLTIERRVLRVLTNEEQVLRVLTNEMRVLPERHDLVEGVDKSGENEVNPEEWGGGDPLEACNWSVVKSVASDWFIIR